MSTIVFACKSNSCRSQMAEGWAQKWLQYEKEHLHSSINNYKTNNLKAKTKHHDTLTHRLSILQNTVVASVALDSGAVFTSPNNHIPTCNCERNQSNKNDEKTHTNTTAGSDDARPSNESQSTQQSQQQLQPQPIPQRKHIKSKAIDAMAKDGVDISSFIPKTVDELIPLITCQRNMNNEQPSSCYTQDASIHPEENKENNIIERLEDHGNPTPSIQVNYDDNELPICQSNGNNTEQEEEKEREEDIDKLIVLCSCGDELKHNLIRRSKSVEEWSIDAPTAAAKAGEGDEAYRRVSLQIREEVNMLMDSLFGEHSLMMES